MAQEQSNIRERQRTDLREPRRYKVTIYNDDFTTMDFVLQLLVTQSTLQSLFLTVSVITLSS